MIDLKPLEIWFVTGSQHLYGPEVLKQVAADSQAIAGWNGSGPFKIENNYLEAAGENVMFGGADPKIPQLVPSDIEFRYNHCAKPVSWQKGILDKPESVVANASTSSGSLSAGATYYYRIAARGRAG